MGKWLYKKIILLFGCFTEIIFPKPSSCSGCGRTQKVFSRYKMCPACYEKLRMYKDKDNELFEIEIIPGQVETTEVQTQACTHTQTQKQVQTQVCAYDKEIVACCYEGIVREMIHGIKYKDKRDIAITIGAFLADSIKEQKTSYDFIVPVPISRKKLSSRGYNHTSLIARELASLANIKVLECLTRIKDTKPQVLFNVSDRWYNVKGCFKCIENIENKRILLVDDIITTGATANFCAEALKAKGARSVTVIAFAKSTLK
jgi:competence protein ComFC